MSTTFRDNHVEGVEFTHEDGLVTAIDLETEVAASGHSKSEALAMLSEALELHEGGGEEIEDEAAFLRSIGIDPNECEPEDSDLPEFMR